MRTCYRCLLWLHPPVFRREYAGEMLWIFDRASESDGALALFVDGMVSLARQWILRSIWWRVVLTLSLATLQIVTGGLAMLSFGRRKLIPAAENPSIASLAEVAHRGAMAHQPVTIGIVLYLAVMITGGLLIMVIGLTFWTRSFAVRRRVIYRGR